MKRAGNALIRIVVTGILFLLLFSGCAAAAEKVLTASCPSRSKETVNARYGKDGYVLSLPGFWDLSGITLVLEDADAVLLGEEQREVKAGEETDVSALTGKKVPLRKAGGKKEEKLTILQGSAIPALFLEVDEKRLQQVNYSKEKQITEGRAV